MGGVRKRRVIALHSDLDGGREEVAAILVREHGFARLGFADPIRRLMYRQNPIIGVETNGTPHHLAELVDRVGWIQASVQSYEMLRSSSALAIAVTDMLADPNLFTDLLEEALLHLPPNQDVAVADLRFPGEHSMLAQYGAVTWWVRKENNPHFLDHYVTLPDVARWRPPEGSYTAIDNNGTLDELAVQVQRLLGELSGEGPLPPEAYELPEDMRHIVGSPGPEPAVTTRRRGRWRRR